MQTVKIKKTINWLLAGIVMAAIFWFSSMNADDSSLQSGFIMNLLNKIFGTAFTQFLVRKAAHFCEYVLLAALFCNAMYEKGSRFPGFSAFAAAAFYAVTDEVHQLFVDGRSCELRDWAIDAGGAAVGAAIAFLIYIILKKVSKNKKQH